MLPGLVVGAEMLVMFKRLLDGHMKMQEMWTTSRQRRLVEHTIMFSTEAVDSRTFSWSMFCKKLNCFRMMHFFWEGNE